MRTFIQKLGKSMMGPLSIIVAAGLLLGITTILTNFCCHWYGKRR